MASLTLRSIKGSPLTNNEIDANFTNLDTELSTKLTATDYNAADILTKLKTVDGTGSGLDADLLDGRGAVSTNTPDTIVLRDGSGNFSANTITAALLSGDILLQAGKTISFEGSVDDEFETTLSVINPTADRTILLPNISGTLVTTSDTGTVTNSMLAGSIANSKLSNSAIIIDGVTVSLGDSITIKGASNAWTSLQTFRDNAFLLTDEIDITKGLRFQLSGITSGNERVLFAPDESGIISTQSNAQGYTQTYVQSYVQTAGRNSQGTKTISTAAPTGGSSGDVWYRV